MPISTARCWEAPTVLFRHTRRNQYYQRFRKLYSHCSFWHGFLAFNDWLNMNSYLIICNDWRLLEEQPQTICDQFERFLDSEAHYLAPTLFAEYSCLTQFVYEEIDLVVSNQQKENDARLTQDEFITFWGWQDKIEKKVYHLSGGWRKLLGISLFMNRKCDNILFIDFVSHLSDKTIEFILEKMKQLRILHVGFAEYDEAILQTHLTTFRRLKQSGARFSEMV
jgi:hypothetical protein